MVARHFGAAKKAFHTLEQYYEHDIKSLKDRTPEFPHPRAYESLSEPDVVHSFKYYPIAKNSTCRSVLQEGKLVFHGKCGDEDIFIKFVRRYSKDAHETCARLGFAPTLRAFATIPGGWHMVIMDYLGDAYEELNDVWFKFNAEVRRKITEEVREKVESLHRAGFVHGDLLGTNIMVKKNGEEGIFLIDFDWAGKISEARYPMNVNRTIHRPPGAVDGELIETEHDIYMVDFLL